MARRQRCLAAAPWVLALAALGHAGAHAQADAQTAERPGAVLKLRLADGSIVHIACGKASTNCPTAAAPPENAWITGSARRAPLKRGTKLFDADKPGVVASIRG